MSVLTVNQSNQLTLGADYHGSRCYDNSSLNSLIYLQSTGAIVPFEFLYEEKFSHQ